MSSSVATVEPQKRASGAVQIAAATIGNALEWFDLLIYGYFASTIAAVFFPNTNQLVSLLLTFGSFGLSYVARPVGAILLGAYADRSGRKAALTLSIWLMVFGTAVLALMPPFAAIGLIAPIGVFAARLLQGFAVAGEFGSSTAFMIEHSAHRKGFYSSWQFAGQNTAKLLAASFGLVLTTQLTTSQMHGWGWRIPFCFGLLVGPVGIYIRRKLQETPEFLDTAPSRTPVREILATQKTGLALGAGLVAVGTASTYFGLYIPTFAVTVLHLPPAIGYIATMITATLATVLVPFAGHLADRVGYRRMQLPATIVMLCSYYPVLLLITRHPSLPTLLGGVIWDTLCQVCYVAALPAVMAHIFPPRVRCTGLSLSYNVGVTLFGGFAPAIFTWLTAVTHNKTAPSLYLMLMALISMVSVILVHRRHPFSPDL